MAFEWHPEGVYSPQNNFNQYGGKVGFIDLSSLDVGNRGDHIIFDFVDEPSAWERFVFS